MHANTYSRHILQYVQSIMIFYTCMHSEIIGLPSTATRQLSKAIERVQVGGLVRTLCGLTGRRERGDKHNLHVFDTKPVNLPLTLSIVSIDHPVQLSVQ